MQGRPYHAPVPRHGAQVILRRLLIVVVAVLACSGVALAYWSSSGAGAATAAVGTLSVPEISVEEASPGAPALTWTTHSTVGTASADAAIEYTVERKLGSGEFVAVDAGSCAGSHAYDVESCTDGVPVGTYTYRVVAHFRTWSSTSAEHVITVASADEEPPTVTVEQKTGQADPTGALPIEFAVQFTEPVSDLDVSDLIRGGTATGGTISLSGSGASYLISVTGALTDGTISFSLAAGVAHDAAGNGNIASTSSDNTVTYDGTVPTASIVKQASPLQADPTNTSPIKFTIAFSETPRNPMASDADGTTVTVPGATGWTKSISPTADPKVFTLTIADLSASGANDGTISAQVNANAITDAAGNGNTASSSASVGYDRTAPAASIARQASPAQADPTNESPIKFTVTFSETPKTPLAADASGLNVSVPGATGWTKTIASTTDPKRFTLTVAGLSSTAGVNDGTVTVSVKPDAITDAAGNGNPASGNATVVYDRTPPAVSFTSPADGATLPRSGPNTLAANASDATTVASVRFQYRQVGSTTWIDLAIDPEAPFSANWNTAALPTGSYELQAIATDGAANTNAATRTVTLAAACAGPGTLSLAADRDTWLDSQQPGAIYGTAMTATVYAKRASANNDDRSHLLVGFPAPSLPPDCNITKIELRLMTSIAGANSTEPLTHDVQAQRAGGAWTEAATTWTNQPPKDATGAISKSFTGAVPVPAGASVIWDVTSLGISQAVGQGYRIVDVQPTTKNGTFQLDFHTREAATATNRPTLIVTYG